MFAKYELDLHKMDAYSLDEYYSSGLEATNTTKNQFIDALDTYVDHDGVIDGSKLRDDWFRAVEADVFISHSHKDERLAICLAGWLYTKFRIHAFVDSCVWGYARNLQSNIDDKYNILEYDGNRKIKTYSHEKVLGSASHVHMMLCTALNKMIDQTECLFFLNTDNSKITAVGQDYTYSPWIYFELEDAVTIRSYYPRTIAARYELSAKSEVIKHNASTFRYRVDLSSFPTLSYSDLLAWANGVHRNPTRELTPLDVLYIRTGELRKID